MKISILTAIAFQINGAIDNGRYNDIGIDVVRREIQNRTILSWLRRTIDGLDLTILDGPMETSLIEEWRDMVMSINVSKKCEVQRGGLTLIMAFLLECIQRRSHGKA